MKRKLFKLNTKFLIFALISLCVGYLFYSDSHLDYFGAVSLIIFLVGFVAIISRLRLRKYSKYMSFLFQQYPDFDITFRYDTLINSLENISDISPENAIRWSNFKDSVLMTNSVYLLRKDERDALSALYEDTKELSVIEKNKLIENVIKSLDDAYSA